MTLIVNLLLIRPLSAGGPTGIDTAPTRVPIFKSRNIRLKPPIHRVSVANPDIADIMLLPNNKLYILGKRLGSTNVMVWNKDDHLVDVFDIEITHDLNGLKERLHRYLPDEPLGVESSQGQLLVSGQASNLTKMNTALELAQGYSRAASVGKMKSKVLNMMTVGGGHQVMLEVVVAEVQREVARQLDANFFIFKQDSRWSGGIAGGNTDFSIDSATGDVLADVFLNDTGFIANYMSSDLMANFALDVAKQHGLAKVLAEPTLTTMSGQKAEFLSGGEFPIPVPGTNGATTISFRDFGVGVKFVPSVLDSGQINLNLNVLVSELSNANSVGLTPNGSNASLFVPSIVKRSTSTTVELADGQSIAISGLISDTLRENIDKLPGLGDIPILGQLFRSQQYRSGQTELIIMVTPRLVRPFNKKGLSLPTDGFVTPSDMEFYLLGAMSQKRVSPGASGTPYQPSESQTLLPVEGGGTQKKYGHSLGAQQ